MEYAEFEEKVKRTLYVDDLSPNVTEAVLRSALDQFGTVKSVQFIPNYLGPSNLPQRALVEMAEPKEAKAIISVLTQFPFMVAGMPRPVRARAAKMEMFDDRPKRPGREIQYCWLKPSDPDFQVAKRLKHLVQKHSAESALMLKQQLLKEEELAKQQAQSLKANYKKYEMVDSIVADGRVSKLAKYYNQMFDRRFVFPG
ncbi:hypothetical protein SLEP1_g50288 [Rubroshorea leprosula]|uniref:RRM domain-containing protein n=1 Tax=Rubroshorea leprosula TaxID=152421 RepID=A0AAV5LZH6_9ROSI|nr:hypothetical protein SLEP1_g50288 [Rubroshorea leprosula]